MYSFKAPSISPKPSGKTNQHNVLEAYHKRLEETKKKELEEIKVKAVKPKEHIPREPDYYERMDYLEHLSNPFGKKRQSYKFSEIKDKLENL